jgi:hypothetical protein
MKSTPARMLRSGQLLVERHFVSKVQNVGHAVPHNVVVVQLTNQLTGEESTRNLQWESIHTTEEPFEFKIGETGTVKLELAGIDEDARALYKYRLTDESAGIDHEATDLRLGARLTPDNKRAAKTLLSDLLRAGEAYETELEGNIDSENLDLFGEDDGVNEWAYAHAEEIEMAHVELIRGLER